jgi:predicted nucleotidyltransferase
MEAWKALAEALQADERIRLAVIFGSAARGASSSQSDLDVGVLGVPVRDLPNFAVQLARVTRREVDLVDLASAPPLLRLEIARDGVLLVSRPTHLWSDFRGQALVDWWDWAPIARRFGVAAMARLDADAR